MRRSISLSPIRTESGANLRTANWTKLKFKGPGQNRNFQNYRGGYHNYNRGGYNNPNFRYQNRGRDSYGYRGNNWNRYIPKRRDYSGKRHNSRSRSRSYSRSRSRERSRSPKRYSYSRSRSHSPLHKSNSPLKRRSRSSSAERRGSSYRDPHHPKTITERVEPPYYNAASSTTDINFGEKVATGLDRWDSPGGVKISQQMQNLVQPPSLGLVETQNSEGNKQFDAEDMQKKMKKIALESVARHEKSLRKIKKAQASKWNDTDSSDVNEEVLIEKKVKKAKKKKANKQPKAFKKATKMKGHKTKLIEVSDSEASSNTESSDDKSSGSDSSSPSPVRQKSKSAAKKKKKTQKSQNNNKEELGGQGLVPPLSGYPYAATQFAQAAQPVMMMAPGMAAGADMKVLGQYGQPLNVIHMPGPDGQMIQFLQIPSMQQQPTQPVIMAPHVVAPPQPVPAPVVEHSLPAHMKVVSIEEEPGKRSHAFSEEAKELSEKQKRRKEIIRTRLWPRPASTPWSTGEENESKENNKNSEENKSDWPLKVKDENNIIPGFDFAVQNEGTKGDESKNIPGLSPVTTKNKNNNFSSDSGQKIPTLGGRLTPSNSKVTGESTIQGSTTKSNVNEVQMSMMMSNAPTNVTANLSTVAYPQIAQGFKPVFSGMPVATSSGHEVVQNVPDAMAVASEAVRRQESRWTAAAEEFIHRSQNASSDEENSSSSDEYSKSGKRKHDDEATRKLKKKSRTPSMKEKSMDEEAKKMKKKKKNKKERKDSVASEDRTSTVSKDKKKKKKKKNKEKDADNLSEPDTKKMKKLENPKLILDEVELKRKVKDDLERHIPQDLPLAHIRGLVVRLNNEGSHSIFSHINFATAKKSSKSSKHDHNTVEDQFVSLFQDEIADAGTSESPLLMSRKSLKKLKIKPQGTRSVTHMTKLTLCERISFQPEEKTEKAKNVEKISQKVSVNLASLSSIDAKFEKNESRSPSRSRSRSRSTSRSRSRSQHRYRSHSRSRSSKSRSKSKSLPKAYSMDADRSQSHEDERRVFRSGGNRYFGNQQQFRYNPRFQHRGRGNFNYRGRGNYYNRGYNNNRGGYFHNRGRGYYNNFSRDRTQPQNWKPHYKDRDGDRRDRTHDRRSRSASHHRDSSYSSDASPRQRMRSPDQGDYHKGDQREVKHTVDLTKNVDVMKPRRKLPDHWAHDKYEEHENASASD